MAVNLGLPNNLMIDVLEGRAGLRKKTRGDAKNICAAHKVAQRHDSPPDVH